MNLLSVLLKAFLAKSVLDALSGKTGLSNDMLKKLIPLALPLLLRYLTNNASSQSGAQSLLGALLQHSSNRSLEEQFEEADDVDGRKILRHIMGDDTERAVNGLANQTGLTEQQVAQALASLAPVLMNSLNAANAQNIQAQQQAQKPQSLLGALLGGNQQPQQPVQQQSPSLLNLLFGGQQQPVQQQDDELDLGDLIGMFTGASQAQQQAPSLLGSLFGTQPQTQQVQDSFNGNTLLNLLSMFAG